MNDVTPLEMIDRRLRREVPDALADTEATADLHRRIMRRVEASAAPRSPRNWGWLAAAGASAAALLAMAGLPRMETADPAPPVVEKPPETSLLQTRMAQLEAPSGLPEQALRDEYERLKSDLRKLGIRS